MDTIQSTLSPTNSVTQCNTSSYSDGMESISQINELMIMLTEILKKLRNTLQEFNQKQQELGWNIQVASMNKKREGIESAYSAASAAAGTQIIGGIVGVAGCPLGQIGMTAGQSVGHMIQGLGQMESADFTKTAELNKLTAELEATNAQNYAKNTNDLADRIRQVSEQMRAFTKDLVELHSRISSSVRH